MSRFFCEARAVAELGSEHLVEVYDFVFEPRKERVAYVMEYLAGDDLRRTLDRNPRILTQTRLREHQQRIDDFARIARHGLETLYEHVAGMGYVVLLTDALGVYEVFEVL